ncbi:MAG: DNA topoisomerase I [Candidatus Diapherotrites archaeon]
MKLIVAEKNIAARRIAELLADGKIEEKRVNNVPVYHFKRNGIEYATIPLKGHIIDVDFPKHYSPWIGTDLRSLVFSNIEYVKKEKNIIEALMKYAKDADEVIFATDYDREGESIALEALHCIQTVKPNIKVKRIAFSAITKQDIEEAFKNPTTLDFNLANSANARREIDLIWGAVLTRFLSIVSGQLGKDFLSAGRVQSPVLALIVDREKEIRAFKPKPYWEVEAIFEKDSKKFSALHKEGRFWEKEKALAVLKSKQPFGLVSKVKIVEKKIKRPVPFNTTSFLKAASSIGISAPQAMSIAEELYQLGYISYPRTDNEAYPATINLKKIVEKLSAKKEFSTYCKELLKKGITPSQGKATKDHPPIHPVDLPKTSLHGNHAKIYELVSRHFLATLGEDAVAEFMDVEILVGKEPFLASGKRYLKLGWKNVYPYSSTEEIILPGLKEGDSVKLIDMKLLEKETKPKPRYSQGSLIKLMEDLGLGTKSTRHEIIRKLYARGYIKGNKAIIPNEIAFATVDALEKQESAFLKPDMTAQIEKEMDEIAVGRKNKETVVDDSRKLLQSVLEELLSKKQEIGKALRDALKIDKKQFPCTRPGCDGILIVRNSRTGKRFLGCTRYPECDVTYPLPQQGKIEPIDKKCPVCQKPMIKVTLKNSRFEMCIDPTCPSKNSWKEKILGESSENSKTK